MPVNRGFVFTFEPERAYTLNTAIGQKCGEGVPLAATPFPLPFREDFENCGTGRTPKCFSDQAGTFLTFARAGKRG